MRSRLIRVVNGLLLSACIAAPTGAQVAGSDSTDLVGLWKAKRRFGPDARGQLILERNGTAYTADMMGALVPVRARNGELSFELPRDGGGFRGKLQSGGSIRGIWFSSPMGSLGSAVPVTLSPMATNRWSGQVEPLDDEQTFFLLVSRRPDGSLGALLRNPERDYGAFLGVRGVVRTGNQIALTGGRQPRDTTVVAGTFDPEQQVMTLEFPSRGGSYDFRRDPDDQGEFYPRGRHPAHYTYRVPPILDDGWVTADVAEVGIDRAAMENIVQRLAEMPMDSLNAPQIHALLIARRGKLVLEEYVHGEYRTRLHNTRSGSKSATATIVGAAMQAGAPITLSTPVYQVMNGGAFPPDLEPRKRAMTLEHLLSMSSGYFCDDNNESAPGNENGIWEQTEEPDFYQLTLRLPMAFDPGDTAIYCSCNPNLALGMLGRAVGESPYDLFDRLVARPLGIRRYVWGHDRARNPYGGGGMGFDARDYMKFGQLMLDGGTWRGRRILPRDFVARASSPLFQIGSRTYGLGWWSQTYPYQGGTVRVFASLGAGGQVVMVIPELELVIATNGGSYISRGWRYVGAELIPNAILPAVAR